MTEVDLAGEVRAASAGDRAAFERIVARYQDVALAICYGRLGQRELARDAAQDAFVDAYLHLSELRDPAAFGAWFRRVLHKHCDRRTRRRRPDPAALEQHVRAHAAAPEDAESALLAAERAHWLHDAIERLPEHERLAVALHYLAGQPVSEIGALLEVEPNAIKQRLHSARRRLFARSEQTMREHMQALQPSRTAAFSDQVALFLAIRTGDEAAVRALLARDRALLETVEAWDTRDFPERDLPVATRATPLIRAAENGALGIVRALLDAGAGVDGGCGCATRETPLWAAIVTGRREVVAELLARGADPGRRARSGIACLHAAAIRGDLLLCELLLAHGADRQQRDGGGRLAADWARLKGHDHLLELLAGDASQPADRAAAADRGAGETFATGIKAIDLFAPFACGSLVLVQGGAGVGRNVLLAELAELARRGGSASVWALWQREPWSDAELHTLLDETRLGEHVHVLTHDHDAQDGLARELPARALAVCDRLLARGFRHVQLTFFERPGVRASIEALLPALGRRADGSAITTFLVPPWQSADEGPAALRAPFDACIAFDRALASALCFPAIDPLGSCSRALVDAGVGGEHAACTEQARALLRLLGDPERDPDAGQPDPAVSRARRLRAYLTQPFHAVEAFSGRPGQSVTPAAMLRDVRAILAGEADSYSVEQLAYRGALDIPRKDG